LHERRAENLRAVQHLREVLERANHEVVVPALPPDFPDRVTRCIHGGDLVNQWEMERNTCHVEGHAATYELLKRLEPGAFAVPYLARVIEPIRPARYDGAELTAGQLVLVKLPRLELGRELGDIIARLQKTNNSFERAFSALARLGGIENTAHVLDCGDYILDLRGQTHLARFIVEEFIDGLQLPRYLKKRFPDDLGRFNGIPDSSDFFALAERLVATVRTVHRQSLIHGDLWPKNVVMRDDEPVLVDFGGALFRECTYARFACGGQESNPYCAPERRASIPREGRRSDIFSLGGILYYMATGQEPALPIADDDVLKNRIVEGIRMANPCLYSGNCAVADMIARCLRYDKYRRIAHADALLCEMRTFSFALAEETTRSSLRDALSRVSKATTELRKDGDHFFASLVELELNMMANRIEDMMHRILDLGGDHETLVANLCRYLSILQEGDNLLIRGVPKLWSGENLGINGRFVSMLRLLAERGVKIRLLFLVSDEDRGNPEVAMILNAHRSAVAAIAGSPQGNSMKGYYRFENSNVRTDLIRGGWQKAVILRGGEASVIEFILDQDQVLRTARFRCRAADAQSCDASISKELRNAHPVEQWFTEEDPVPLGDMPSGTPVRSGS